MKKSSSYNLIFGFLFITAYCPYFHIGPLSLSFLFGILFVLSNIHQIGRNVYKPLLFFMALAAFSLMLSSTLNLSDAFTVFQIGYWYCICQILFNTANLLDKKLLSQLTVAVVYITIAIYAILGSVTNQAGGSYDNSVSFIIVTIWPLGLYCFKHLDIKLIYILSVLICQTLIDSRTGQIILFIQVIALFSLKYINKRNTLTVFLVIAFVVAFFNADSLRYSISKAVFPANSEIAEIIEEPEVVFNMDKSWAQRLIQQKKCIQVFEENPIFGIGPTKVANYGININLNSLDIDSRILRHEYTRSDNRSSHNAYYQMLAENGLIGCLILILVLIYPLRRLVKFYKLDELSLFILVSLIGFYLNLYMVSGFWGTNTFVALGLALGYSRYIENLNNKSKKNEFKYLEKN